MRDLILFQLCTFLSKTVIVLDLVLDLPYAILYQTKMPYDNVVFMYSWSGVFLFSFFFFFFLGGGGLTTGTAPGSNIFTVGNATGNYTLFNYILHHLSLPSNHATEHCVDLSLLPFAMVLIITL